MVQGSGVMGELLGRRRRRRRRCHLGIQVDIQAKELHLKFFHMVLGSWWEIFENGDRASTQNFDTNLMSIMVWPGKPFSKKCLFDLNSKVTMLVFPGTCSKNNLSLPEPSPWSRPPAARISRIWENRKTDFQYFQATRKLENFNFQYFQATRKLEKSNFQYFQATRKSEKSNFQYFQDYR